MPPANDCCCFCLTAKAGVTLIGLLTWLNFLGSVAAGVTLARQQWHDTKLGALWYFLPGFILYGIVGCVHSNLGKYEGTHRDFKKRNGFWKSYFVCIVLLHSIATVILNVTWLEQLVFSFKGEADRIYYGRCTFDYNRRHEHPEYDCGHFWLEWSLTLILNIYFCYVSMKYADLANPAQRRNYIHARELQD